MPKITAWTLLLILAVPALADDSKSEAEAGVVAPFLDDQTIAVGHVDLRRVNVDAIAGKLSEYGQLKEEEIAGPKKEVGAWLAAWTKAGVREVFVVVSLADVPGQPPLVVVPLEEGADAKGIAEALTGTKPFRHFQFEKIGSAVVGGGQKTLTRLKSLKPRDRPELAKAFAAAGDTAVQVQLIPTDDFRRVTEEIMPRLPAELGTGPITILTHGLLWAALGAELTPKSSVRLVVQSQDAAAAQKLAALTAQFLHAVGEEGPKGQKARDILPGFDRLAEQLTLKIEGNRLVVTLDEKGLAASLQPIVARVLGTATSRQSANKLQQIGLALHNYHDRHRHFPAVANFDKANQPLLSWRVHLLPFLDQEKLYKEFHLDEPWDSAHNKQLIAKMPPVYRSSKNQELLQAGKTTYLAPVGGHLMFTGTSKTLQFRDVTDGTSNTIFVVDVDDDHAAIWTKPEDFTPDPKKPADGLANRGGNGFVMLWVDGSVHRIPANIDAKTLYALFTRDGGENVSPP